MSTTQAIKLGDETSERLKTLAQQRNRSAHWVMRTAILDYLDREERYEKERQEDAERWERYVFTGKVISEEEAETRLKKLIES